MRRILLTLTTLFFLSFSMFAAGGHDIKIKIDGFQEKQISLGYHYGDKQYIKDTVSIDSKGYFTFKGDTLLDSGVYLIIMPPENQYFQILIGQEDQTFTIETSQTDPVADIKIKGSEDNSLFYDYLKYLSSKIPMQQELHEMRKKVDGSEKMAEINSKLDVLDKEVKKYHTDLITKHSNTMTAVMVKARLETEIPTFEGDEQEVSKNRYLYYKSHYFENIDLGDPKVLRTPFLYQRVTYYEEKLTPAHPDSIAVSLDYLLGQMKSSEDTYKYYLIHFLNKYASSKVVGMDKVYVHLAQNYYCKGMAPWTSEEQIEKICDNASRIIPTLIGTKARNITTLDRNGAKKNLFDLNTDYTILYFWAPDCGHCKKMTPFLIDFHEKYKSKGVSVFTVCKPKSKDFKECWDYIDEKENMDNMVHTYDPSQRAQVYYNIRSTPVMFILDKNKEIIMKGIGADDLEKVMEQIMEREKNNAKR